MQIDAVGVSGQELDFERLERSHPESRFQGAIFSPHNHSEKFSREAVICANRSLLDHKVERTFLNSSHASQMMVTKNRGGASVEFHTSIEWGGKEDPKVSFGAKSEVYDNKGNYAALDYNRDHKGESKTDVSFGVGPERPSSNESPSKPR